MNEISVEIDSSINNIANNECIICMEIDDLIDNILCENRCKFKYHNKCYANWLSISNKKVCLLCKKTIEGNIEMLNAEQMSYEDEINDSSCFILLIDKCVTNLKENPFYLLDIFIYIIIITVIIYFTVQFTR